MPCQLCRKVARIINVSTTELEADATHSLDNVRELERMLIDMGKTLAKTCRQNTRSNPSTFELLNDVDLLEYSLT
jgi:hypothetical protein